MTIRFTALCFTRCPRLRKRSRSGPQKNMGWPLEENCRVCHNEDDFKFPWKDAHLASSSWWVPHMTESSSSLVSSEDSPRPLALRAGGEAGCSRWSTAHSSSRLVGLKPSSDRDDWFMLRSSTCNHFSTYYYRNKAKYQTLDDLMVNLLRSLTKNPNVTRSICSMRQ